MKDAQVELYIEQFMNSEDAVVSLVYGDEAETQLIGFDIVDGSALMEMRWYFYLS